MDVNRFSTHTLRSAPWGSRVQRILAAALEAVEPGEAVQRFLKRSGEELSAGEYRYDLSRFRRVLVVGAGKAGAPMARAAAQVLGARISQGIVLVKEGYAGSSQTLHGIEIVEAGHPIPDERGIRGARQIANLFAETREDDLVIGLISGGASAIMVSLPEGISLAELQELTALLLASGASVDEINTIRKHIEALKGGKLARQAFPASLITLILSDVVGDPLEVIGSGPSVPDPTTYADAFNILQKYNILEAAPQTIRVHLERGLRGEIPETPKPGETIFRNVRNILIGSNALAAEAALRQAQAEGFHTLLLTTYLQGEARQAGRLLASIARQIARDGRPLSRPACLVAGGETTVTLQGKGLGGRNQELALGAVSELAGLREVALVSLASDGGDGVTGAAGAVVTGETLERARSASFEPSFFLSRNDSYNFFDPLGDLLEPGPTQTNVNDLVFLFAF
jgi:hydroxypyruvate reductase